MMTILFWGAIGLVALLLFSKIGILEHALKPFFTLFEKFVEVIFMSFFGWWLWIIKAVWRAHADLITHLGADEEDYDIELKMKKKMRE